VRIITQNVNLLGSQGFSDHGANTTATRPAYTRSLRKIEYSPLGPSAISLFNHDSVMQTQSAVVEYKSDVSLIVCFLNFVHLYGCNLTVSSRLAVNYLHSVVGCYVGNAQDVLVIH